MITRAAPTPRTGGEAITAVAPSDWNAENKPPVNAPQKTDWMVAAREPTRVRTRVIKKCIQVSV